MGLVCGLIVLLIVIVTARLRWVERSSVLRSVGQWLAAAWTKWGAEMSPAMSHTGLPAVVSPEVATKSQSGQKARTARPLKPRSADDCALCRAEGRGQDMQCRHREMERVYDRKTKRELIPLLSMRIFALSPHNFSGMKNA